MRGERFNCIWRDAARNDQKNETPLFSPDEPAPGVFRALVTFDLLRLSHAFRVLLWHFAAYELLRGDMKKKKQKKKQKIRRYTPSPLSFWFSPFRSYHVISLIPCFLLLPLHLCPTFFLTFTHLSFARFYYLIPSFSISLPISLSGSLSLLPTIPQRLALLLTPVRSFPPAVFSYP